MLSDVIQTAKYGTATKEIIFQILLRIKILLFSESYLGPLQHLNWNSLWRKLTTEGH